jgi:RimJ/RimL family protein N-acetyltransferase
MSSTNPRVIDFNLAIGFKREATLREHFGPKDHAVITSMLRPEFRRLYRHAEVREDVSRIAA